MKKRLLVISDGNGVSTDFKKWPSLLEVLCTKTVSVVNRSVIGASNELILMRLSEAVQEQDFDHAIIQWSVAPRVDVIVDEFWQSQADSDPVYYFNLVNCNDQRWWVTSKSDNSYIREYHSRYIQHWQSHQRSQSYMLAAAELLRFHQIPFNFSLCYNFKFADPYKSVLETYPWIWHQANSGLSEFRHQSKFQHLDQGLAQPHSLINLDWINQVLKPSCTIIDYSDETYYNVEQYLIKQCSK